MVLLNIDKFQKFNDVYGEEIGNITLKMSGEFLSNYANGEDTFLYHIGGDEFGAGYSNFHISSTFRLIILKLILHLSQTLTGINTQESRLRL